MGTLSGGPGLSIKPKEKPLSAEYLTVSEASSNAGGLPADFPLPRHRRFIFWIMTIPTSFPRCPHALVVETWVGTKSFRRFPQFDTLAPCDGH